MSETDVAFAESGEVPCTAYRCAGWYLPVAISISLLATVKSLPVNNAVYPVCATLLLSK